MTETTTWWKADRWLSSPQQVEVVRESVKTLTIRTPHWRSGEIKNHRVLKRTSDACYFRTEAEAAGWLIERAHARVAEARRALEQANGALGNLRGKYPDHPSFQKNPAA